MRDRAKNLIDSWLEVQSQLLVGSLRAIVLVGNPDAGPVMPAAVWPDTGASTPGLSNAAASALQQRRIVVRAKGSAPAATRQRGDIVAAPIIRDKDVIGVAAVEITARPQAEQRRAAKILALNTVWLELLMREGPARNDSHTLAVVDLVAASVERAHFEAAANSTATRFATRLGCERVSLGFLRRDHVEVRTMSGTATLNPKRRLTRAIGAAMDEAITQVAVLRGRLGAFERNTLQPNARQLQITIENLTSSQAVIRDTDFAAETSELTRAQILVQAGNSILAIANAQSQNVLSLLGG